MAFGITKEGFKRLSQFVPDFGAAGLSFSQKPSSIPTQNTTKSYPTNTPRANELEIAIRNNDIDSALAYLQQGYSPIDSMGNSLLPIAVKLDSLDMLQALLSAGVDPNEPGALNVAVKYKKYDALAMLLEAGADPNTNNYLKSAISNNDQELYNLLTSYGAVDYWSNPSQ